ncbi:hypothetical protein EPN52_07045 [bacterium]|nr:MAG: hypothetical protein EPN52_07045 [bacterium]
MKTTWPRTAMLLLLVAAGAVAFAQGDARAFGITAMRAQKSVYVLINVTPSPIVYRPRSTPHGHGGHYAFGLAAARASTREAGWVADTDPVQVAQVSAQGAVPVQANVTPDPTSSLLHTNTAAISLSGTAGTTIKAACAFTVTVGTTAPSWTLYTGLSADFAGTTFPGSDLAYNMYVTTPASPETYTAYVVYPDNNNNWAVATPGNSPATYCVDLQLTIPGSVPGGSYSSNAVYSLYY